MPKIKSIATTVIEEDWGFKQPRKKRRVYLSYDFEQDLEADTNEIVIQDEKIKPSFATLLIMTGAWLYLIDSNNLETQEPKILIKTGWRLSSEEERAAIFHWIIDGYIHKKKQEESLQQSIHKTKKGLIGATLELVLSFTPIGSIIIGLGKFALKLRDLYIDKRSFKK